MMRRKVTKKPVHHLKDGKLEKLACHTTSLCFISKGIKTAKAVQFQLEGGTIYADD